MPSALLLTLESGLWSSFSSIRFNRFGNFQLYKVRWFTRSTFILIEAFFLWPAWNLIWWVRRSSLFSNETYLVKRQRPEKQHCNRELFSGNIWQAYWFQPQDDPIFANSSIHRMPFSIKLSLFYRSTAPSSAAAQSWISKIKQRSLALPGPQWWLSCLWMSPDWCLNALAFFPSLAVPYVSLSFRSNLSVEMGVLMVFFFH